MGLDGVNAEGTGGRVKEVLSKSGMEQTDLLFAGTGAISNNKSAEIDKHVTNA